MSRVAASARGIPRISWRVAAWAIVAAVVVVFIVANVHLAFIAFGSQRDCALQDDATVSGETNYRAASPVC
jgi:hypothetical protein